MEERIIVADPVAQPKEYQRELLALLGGRDPLDVLAATSSAVRDLAAGVPADVLTTRPEPAEWSAAEVLGHIWDAELVVSFRGRSILGQDEPSLMGYDQDAWALLPRPPFPVLVEAFEAVRAANLHLARSISAADWDRVGLHSERGRMSFRLLFEEIAGHDIAHLRQLEQTLAAVAPR
jgi:DinB superfamily